MTGGRGAPGRKGGGPPPGPRRSPAWLWYGLAAAALAALGVLEALGVLDRLGP